MGEEKKSKFSRRTFTACLAGMGLGATALPKLLWAKVQQQGGTQVTAEMVKEAEKLAGLTFTDEERGRMARSLSGNVNQYRQLREFDYDPNLAPAVQFNPALPSEKFPDKVKKFRPSKAKAKRHPPANLEELAFWPVTELAPLLRERKVKSVDLTKMYLARLKKYDGKLLCVVNLTEELALKQAKRADDEIAKGKYRGPLHGIPWGAKDLLAAKGYPTTWGSEPHKDQVFDYDATCVERLEEAGAVLVAKLTLGALAMGDGWFGGRTRNPWNTEQGSSGSSAGPASATVAGCVGFSIGSETLGSIVSPCSRCGATGLRPSFGRISRHGAMPLSWSMDKLGPICRTVEDCALVFDAVCGPDGKDQTIVDLPFNWNMEKPLSKLTIGYVKPPPPRESQSGGGERGAARGGRGGQQRTSAGDSQEAVLDIFRKLGCKLVEIELPTVSLNGTRIILNVESAASFDEFTRGERDNLLTGSSWPNSFRTARMVPAVEYIQANRVRMAAMQQMSAMMEEIDLYLSNGRDLQLTNLTGHPCCVLPSGFRENGTPTSINFIGKLFREDDLMLAAKAYQDATGHHLKHPVIEL